MNERNPQTLQALTGQLGARVDALFEAHGPALGLEAGPPRIEDVTLNDLSRPFQPERLGDFTVEALDRLEAQLAGSTATEPADDAGVEADPTAALETLDTARRNAAQIRQHLQEAWQGQQHLATALEPLFANGNAEDACACLAQQSRFALEQRRLLLLATGACALSKQCLEDVLQLLLRSRSLLAMAYNVLSMRAATLSLRVNAVVNAIQLPALGQPAPAQVPLGPVNLMIGANNAYKAAVAAGGAVTKAVATSNQLLAAALAQLLTCLAWQALGGLLLQELVSTDAQWLDGLQRQCGDVQV